MKQPLHLSESIPSDLALVPAFIDAAKDQILPFISNEDDVFAIKLCLEEAVANAVKHGNKNDVKLNVTVELKGDKEVFVMQVTDEGAGFDSSLVPDPTQNENLSKPHGRGIFIIKKYMDEVEFLDNGRTIRMAKKLTKGG